MTSCRTEREEIINSVTSKYTTQEINYFYELCFNEKEVEGTYLKKWSGSIFFYLDGYTIPGDEKYLLEIASIVNDLGLPINIRETKNKKEANLIFISSTPEKLKLEKPRLGATKVFNTESQIDSAIISISNAIHSKKRRSIISHEFLHALGFSSHAVTDSKSILFAINDSTQAISEKEKRVLSLLYNTNWRSHYTSTDFEDDFSLSLYHINAQNKFVNYLKTNNVDSSMVNLLNMHGTIRPTTLFKPCIIKHAKSLRLAIKNVPSVGIADTLGLFIDELNSATTNFHLIFSRDSVPNYGVVIEFVQAVKEPDDYLGVSFSNVIYTDKHATLNTIVSTKIIVRYKKNSVRLRKLLGNILYQAMVLKDYTYHTDFFEDNDQIRLKPKYKQFLNIYYAPELSNNFSKSNLEKIVENYKQ